MVDRWLINLVLHILFSSIPHHIAFGPWHVVPDRPENIKLIKKGAENI
jgi:hypothetical protein